MQDAPLLKSLLQKTSYQKIKSAILSLENDQIADFLLHDWHLWARDKQRLPKETFIYWLILAGRGFGKTRTGAETIRIWSENNPRMHLVGATASDVRDIMVEGESGIMSIFPKQERPHYEPSKKRVTFKNGAICELFSADEPDRLRGPQCYKAWADELAAWRYAEAWDQLKFGLRLGNNPQCIVTTTPRPTKVIKELIKDEHTHCTTGSTFENKDNLAQAFIHTITKKYENTTLGRQEIYAEILEDIEGALWKRSMINHVKSTNVEFERIVIAIDPAVTSKKKSKGDDSDSDETSVTVVGLGRDKRGYVLDNISGIWTPDYWAKLAIKKYNDFGADRIIGEANNGGDLIEYTLRTVDPNVSYKSVHASKGKIARAEPIVALYEQGKIDHVGMFDKLEDEMTAWDINIDDYSPNNIDSLVWGLTELMITNNTYSGGVY